MKHMLRLQYGNSNGPSYDLIYDLLWPPEDRPSDVSSDFPQFSLNFDISWEGFRTICAPPTMFVGH